MHWVCICNDAERISTRFLLLLFTKKVTGSCLFELHPMPCDYFTMNTNNKYVKEDCTDQKSRNTNKIIFRQNKTMLRFIHGHRHPIECAQLWLAQLPKPFDCTQQMLCICCQYSVHCTSICTLNGIVVRLMCSNSQDATQRLGVHYFFSVIKKKTKIHSFCVVCLLYSMHGVMVDVVWNEDWMCLMAKNKHFLSFCTRARARASDAYTTYDCVQKCPLNLNWLPSAHWL